MSEAEAKFNSLKNFSEQELMRLIVIELSEIKITLWQMKEQEHQYWQTWKEAKERENK